MEAWQTFRQPCEEQLCGTEIAGTDELGAPNGISGDLRVFCSVAIPVPEFESSREQEMGGSLLSVALLLPAFDVLRASQALGRCPAPNGPERLRHTTLRAVA